MEQVFDSQSPEETAELAGTILEACKNHNIYAIYGDLGAGKTTLIKAFCEILGVVENTSSPTFSIVNEYDSANGKIYHFDFYRIKNSEEAFDLGYEEYFFSGNRCFIEWPELVEALLPEECVRIKIEHGDSNSRKVTLLYNPKINERN